MKRLQCVSSDLAVGLFPMGKTVLCHGVLFGRFGAKASCIRKYIEENTFE